MMIMVVGDCLTALKFFYFSNLYFSNALIVILFSISHFLVIIGITKERKKSAN